MASMQRKLARGIVRNECYKRDGNIKAFRAEWDKVHYQRKETVNENGNIVSYLSRKGKKRNNKVVIANKVKAIRARLAKAIKRKPISSETAVTV